MNDQRIEMNDGQPSTSSLETSPAIPEDKYIQDALKALDDKGWSNFEDFLESCDKQPFTLYHLAAYRGDLEKLKFAADKGADLCATDRLGKCALHYAASQGHGEAVKWLLKRDELESLAHSQVNIENQDGSHPQDTNDRGSTQRKGLCLANKDATNKTVVDAIFQNVPQPVAFLTEILDEQVTCSEFGEKVTMEFRMLVALPSCTNTPSPRAFEGISILQVLFALITPVSMIESTAIIQHPLVAHFLQTIRIPRNLWQFILSILTLAYYIALCWIISRKTSIDGECFDSCVVCPIIGILSLGLFVWRTASFFILSREFHNFMVMWNYRPSIIVLWVVNLLVNILAVCACTCRYFYPGIFLTILLPWVFIMQILNYCPRRGQYIFMFFTVLYTVLKVLGTFAAVIFSFAYSFSMLFPDLKQFGNVWKSLVTTLVMMTGEYEYNNSLFPNATNSTSVQNNDSGFVISLILFLIFVIVMNIVFINLMNSLAVSDIKQLLDKSRSGWLKLRAVILLHTLSRRYVTRWIYKKLGRSTNEATSIQDLGLTSTSQQLLWNKIPEDIKEGIREVVLRKSSNRDKKSDNKMNSPRDNTQLEILIAMQSSLAAVESSQAAMQSSLQGMVVEQGLQNSRIEQLTQHRKTE